MSKFLKVIVNLVIIAAIVVAVALLIPPFAGVYTVMNDNTETDTNLPVGSVAYGTSASASELEVGDRIIYSEGSRDYIYEITDIDSDGHSYTVNDVYDNNSDTETVTIRSSVPRVILVLPFIGYAAIALQTTEGLIVAGAIIVVLIILFILSEVLRKDRKEEDEEEDEPEMQAEALEESEDQTEELTIGDPEEEEQAVNPEEEEVASEAEESSYQAEEQEDTESGSSGDASEDDDYDQAIMEAVYSAAEESIQVSGPEQVPDATIIMPDIQEKEESFLEEQEDLIMEDSYGPETEVLETELDVEELEESPPETENAGHVEEILDPEGTKAETDEEDPEDILENSETPVEIPEPEDEEEVINPEAVLGSPTVEELLEKAREAGDEPEIIEDKENQVTLLDYSKIL